ncbi:MAG: crotonyl-CoA carboxylase/reductase [Solirubrobacterales bacterium]
MSVLDQTVALASPEELLVTEVPATYKAAYVERGDAERLAGVKNTDVRETLKVGEVPMPELAPDEALVAVMAAAINYNTIWSARFEPIPGFFFLHKLGQGGGWDARHDQPKHVLGSDAAGVVVRTGENVKGWSAGDRVVTYPGWADSDRMFAYDDAVIANTLAWGFETNFGSLAHFAIVKATQLMKKPTHLTWEESAANTLCAMTAYRMLVSPRGASFKQGDIVFVWGAAGGLGSYAIQMIRNGGGIAVGVVNSDLKASLLEELGCDLIIRRDELETDGLKPHKVGKLYREQVRAAFGEDAHLVFEHVGAKTFPASVYLLRPGGKVITCGSSSGYQHEFDNRYLWMKGKTILGSHGATPQEARECNRLFDLGQLQPALSKVVPLDDVAEAAHELQANEHVGKVGVLCMAEEEGLGIEDAEKRAAIGEDKITMFRRFG